LKQLIYYRDGHFCPLTGYDFDPNSGRAVKSRTAHILPFSFHKQLLALQTIERFTGCTITAKEIQDNINDPRNAFNVESNAHDYYDNLSWGIEARVEPTGEHKYYYRTIRHQQPATITHPDNTEISFGGGTNGQLMDPPCPEFCNLKLAIARTMHACGASEIIDLLFDDEDDEAIMTLPVYFGGPCVADDKLFHRLHERLGTL